MLKYSHKATLHCVISLLLLWLRSVQAWTHTHKLMVCVCFCTFAGGGVGVSLVYTVELPLIATPCTLFTFFLSVLSNGSITDLFPCRNGLCVYVFINNHLSPKQFSYIHSSQSRYSQGSVMYFQVLSDCIYLFFSPHLMVVEIAIKQHQCYAYLATVVVSVFEGLKEKRFI